MDVLVEELRMFTDGGRCFRRVTSDESLGSKEEERDVLGRRVFSVRHSELMDQK